jgi:hypothetical protein
MTPFLPTVRSPGRDETKRTSSSFYVEAIRHAIVMSTLSRLSNELCHSIHLPAYSVASAVNPVFSWLRQSRSRIFAVNVAFGRRKTFGDRSFCIRFGETIGFNYFALPVFDLALIIPARDGKLFPLKLLLHGATANVHRRGQRFVLVR